MTVLPTEVMRELAGQCLEPAVWAHGEHVTLDDSFYTRADNVILIYEDGLNERLHRKLWRLVRPDEPIDGMVLIRECSEPRCVNPFHHRRAKTSRQPLAPGSAPAMKKRLTICHNGHSLTGENLLLHRDKAGYMHRECRQCKLDRPRKVTA